MRLLVVDDDDAYLRLVEQFLRGRGYPVVTAKSGETAVKLAIEADVALIDMVMPGWTGVETIPWLLRNDPELKVIASSGCSEKLFRADLDRLGVTSFLEKPFTVERLLELVERFELGVAA